MKLSRSVSYALQAVLILARSEGDAPTPCSHLAAEGGMPERFLLQILRGLVTKGILRSTRGVDGGYTLVRPPAEISLLEVIEAVEGPLDGAAPAGVKLPADSFERLQQALRDAAESARRQLGSLKLVELLASPTRADGSVEAGAPRAEG